MVSSRHVSSGWCGDGMRSSACDGSCDREYEAVAVAVTTIGTEQGGVDGHPVCTQ